MRGKARSNWVRGSVWVSVLAVGTAVAGAQAELRFGSARAGENADGAALAIGGTPTIDFIRWKGTAPSAPLRFGNVVPNSERVQLGSRVLQAGADYAIDYEVGVVFLKTSVRTGDTLTVSYRYLPPKDPNAARQYSGIAGFSYQLVPGSLSLVMGLGMTERAADGSVMSTNAFGFNNSMNFGSGSVRGMYVMAQRERNDVRAGLSMNPNARGGNSTSDEGNSQAILQNVTTRMMGGNLELDYQNVSDNFTAFNQFAGAGFDDATLNRLRSERGLTRFGIQVRDMKVGSAAFSSGLRNVQDTNGAIEWRNYGLQSGGLKMSYDSRRVDAGFNRFRDIAEEDREQMMRERGMTRQNLAAEFAQKAGKLSFNAQSITDDTSNQSIERRSFGLDVSNLSFQFEDQEISEGFHRWDHLLAPERQTWGREAGLRRQRMALSSGFLGGESPLKFSQSLVMSSGGAFRANDLSAGNKGWSLQHTSRRADTGFGRMGSLQDAELDGHISSVASMYGTGVQWRPEDRHLFRNLQGISREYTAIKATPFKNWDIAIRNLSLLGSADAGHVRSAEVEGRNVSFSARQQHLGAHFGELSQMMEFERQRLGPISGMERSDVALGFRLGGDRKLDLSKLDAKIGESGLNRTSLAYTDRKIEVRANTREVDPTMVAANQLVDPEKDFLQALAGFSQRDLSVRWQLLPNVRVDMFDFQSVNNKSMEDRDMQRILLNWKPTSGTNVEYFRHNQRHQDPVDLLFAHEAERLVISQSLGRYGNLRILDERISFDGTQTQAPDSRRQQLTLETKVGTTGLRTEQTRTSFDNGDKENISANTISKDLSNRLSVSVTDTRIDRGGEDRDEKRRNYGFWWDLGRGLRLSYGYIRHLNGFENGTMTSTASIGTGSVTEADKVGQIGEAQVAGLNMRAAYGTNTWDHMAGRTQSFSNVTLSTAKPIQLGPISDLTFAFGYDAAADYSNWLRENRLIRVGGKIGGNTIGYEFRSQMHPNGYRGIDRMFRFETRNSERDRLRAGIMYKARTLPWDQQVMIRDITLAARLGRGFEIQNKLRTNPEVARSDALLGSVTQADRSNEWSLDWQQGANFRVVGSWRELINDQSRALVRTGGLTFRWNEGKGSPFTIFYGVEEADGNVPRRQKFRYHVQFDQRPGPNQQFSIFMGNITYGATLADGKLRDNITVRLDYQFRF